LAQLVAEQKFRKDLYYRVNVVNVRLPPMRERASDVTLLANHFLRRFTADTKREIRSFTDAAMAAMLRYPWQGNVRELENAVERAVVLCRRPQIDVDDLPETVQFQNSAPRAVIATASARAEDIYAQPMALDLALEGPERQIIEAALKRNAWNRQATA